MGAVLALAILLGAGFVFGGNAADGFAYVADAYGGVEAAGLWYYDDYALALYEAKETVDGWKQSLAGTPPVVIAVVDTGITPAHDIFEDVLLKNAAGEVLGDNSTVADGGGNVDISDTSSGRHGNRVAGVIAMLIHEMGLEDFIKIYPIKASVLNKEGQDAFSVKNVTEAINRAVDKADADVINFSFGIQYSEQTKEWATDAQLAYAIDRASTDALIVAAAGNNSKKASAQATSEAFYPAALDGVFSVMGYGRSGDGALALYDRSNYGSLYDIAAPAQNIYSATDVYGASAYGYDNGTSMAAPIVSFAAALVKLRYRAEGREEPEPQLVARLLKSFDYTSILHDGAEIECLDLLTLVSEPIEEIDIDYSAPTGIRVTHDAVTGTGELANVIYYEDPRSVPEIRFVASLTPYGMTDPELDDYIVWSLRDADGVETELGRGETLSYKPTVFGDTEIVARLGFGSNVQGVQRIRIKYLKFVAGDARVTFERYMDSPPRSVPTSGVLYTGATTVFTFTGARYVDPSVEIKWYVDRQYVASGRTFAYKPTVAGEHIISVQYGDNPPTHTPGVAFTAEVKPFILRPLDLSMLILGGVIVIVGAGILVAATIRRKRRLSPPEPKAPKPAKPKKEKRDKNIKIAKR